MQSLLSRLHDLPNLGILFVIVVVIAGLAMAAPHIGHRLLRLKANEARGAAAVDAFKAVLAMTGVVLAFALVEANNNLHSIESLVAKEGAALAATDRALLRSGDPSLVAARPLLAAYGKSIVEDEWPLLAGADRSDATDDAYNALWKAARVFSPADAKQQLTYTELLKSLDDLADLREQRIAESDSELPTFFWMTTAGLLLVALVLALLSPDTIANTVSLGATAAAVALLLAFVVIVDQPFEGETSVKSKEISKALALNARRS